LALHAAQRLAIRGGIGLADPDRIRSDDGVEISTHAQGVDELPRKSFKLVGADAKADPFGFQPVEQSEAAGKRRAVHGDIVAVIGDERPIEALDVLIAERVARGGEPASDELARPMADKGAHVLERHVPAATQ